MINEEYFQLWKEVISEIDIWENIIKMNLEMYFRTQDIQYINMLIEGTNILLSKKEKEDELYKKLFI